MNSNSAITGLNFRYKKLIGLIEQLNVKISILPPGRIRIDRHYKQPYFYHVDETTDEFGRRLGPNDQQLIDDLIQKQYFTKVLRSAEREKRFLEKLITQYPDQLPEDVYDRLCPERKARAVPIIKPDDEFVREWQNRPFKTKGIKDGLPRFTTLKGEEVRSKSEKIIADHFYLNNVPYKYECPLVLAGETIHPDFTILRVSDRKEIYHEHLGAMDSEDYTADIPRRVNLYIAGGIYQGDRLFMSFESLEYPLDMRQIEEMTRERYR
ncbi:MAG: hypothetical protein J6X33_08535 [Clostridiales bacterium]|nr:hypothetical protein [Clostridiales bacterium]